MQRTVRWLTVGALLLAIIAVSPARADIFRWDNGQLIPGTEGVMPAPGVLLDRRNLEFALLSFRDMSRASFELSNLSYADFDTANLTGANFTQANLTYADLFNAKLTNAIFEDAIVTGATFDGATRLGLSREEFYSTASYKAKDLSGIHLSLNDLSGWNLAAQNLTRAFFYGSKLAELDLANAVVMGAGFEDTTRYGFSKHQLYSTASYAAKDLRSTRFSDNDLSGWDFSRQDLAGASLARANLSDVSFRGANLALALFHGTPTAAGIDFSFADTRRAQFLPDGLIHNTISPVGNIFGLKLVEGERLVVRDSVVFHQLKWQLDPVRISVGFHSSGALRLLLDDDGWDSPISFQPGIPVDLGGSLELAFANGVDPTRQFGHTFKLFDWTGVTPTRRFDIVSDYQWDTTHLYSTGEVTLIPEAATWSLMVCAIMLLTATYAISKQRARQ